MKEVICTCCPQGCHLQVDEANDYKVTGNGCPNGIAYGKEELAEVVAALDSVVLHAPIHVGDVVLTDVCGTGADIVTCRDMA